MDITLFYVPECHLPEHGTLMTFCNADARDWIWTIAAELEFVTMVDVTRVSYGGASTICYHEYCEQYSVIQTEESVGSAPFVAIAEDNCGNVGARSRPDGQYIRKQSGRCRLRVEEMSTQSFHILNECKR